jgi:hypothetical protein
MKRSDNRIGRKISLSLKARFIGDLKVLVEKLSTRMLFARIFS